VTIEEMADAEVAMRALGQTPLFQVRAGDDALDALLAGLNYSIVDPVNLYVAPLEMLTVEKPPRVSTFSIWEPLEIMREIWGEGGIGPARIAVMERVKGPKTGLFGRHQDQPAATGFAAIHSGVAMVHALEVHARHRRAGMGRLMMLQAAHWAQAQGAQYLSVICTKSNQGANGLYSKMGFTHVGDYHYRQKD
jgi:ribosomal protein S18 acetylase RimI-like enzyme